MTLQPEATIAPATIAPATIAPATIADAMIAHQPDIADLVPSETSPSPIIESDLGALASHYGLRPHRRWKRCARSACEHIRALVEASAHGPYNLSGPCELYDSENFRPGSDR